MDKTGFILTPVEVKSICGINKNKKLFEIYTFDHIWLPENLIKP
jgi:hypothetical protein